MKAILSFFVLGVAISTALAGAPFQLCKNAATDAKVTAVGIPNCSGPPCILKKGTNATVTITLTTAKVFTGLSNKVYGEIGGFDVPFPGYPADQVDMCKLGVTCPTKAGSSYTEKVILPVFDSDPSISLTVQWKFADSKGDIVGCFEVPLKISS